ncbi:MAG: aldolase catalytic domain-containing protein [Lachnospiraceae bacterium]|nr:aldolase catalytic domain-containing protein [Lachnospiraceae bacterium]
MGNHVQLLDCTLRDGAYIVNSEFGVPAIKGIIKKMQESNVDIIECGWLKNDPHKKGTSFYHIPSDLEQYLPEKDSHTTYVAMIDWDRYDLNNLPPYDGRSIDAIRVVFPHAKFKEGITLGKVIKEKGYQVYFQAANTLGYHDSELIELAQTINHASPVCLSVVDTFGAMYSDNLSHIVSILDQHLDKNIKLGFHSHNNQQLSFALTMQFIEMLQRKSRACVVDASLCGMGRGAGNATTELVANFLNHKFRGNYDMNIIMDTIDMYMQQFQANFQWGYSTPNFIAGMYCTHVNNIAYLLQNHRTTARDMRNIIESLSPEDRKTYNYDLLEEKYIDYQNKTVDDELTLSKLKEQFKEKEVLLLLPGRSLIEEKEIIDNYIQDHQPVIIGVNAVFNDYTYDYIFFSNKIRYDYAKEIYSQLFRSFPKIVSSSIKTVPAENEMIVNFNLLVKRGWDHFDNSGIMCLRLLNKLHVSQIALAGFDGFGNSYDENYADISLPHINPGKEWDELNSEINDMLLDFERTTKDYMHIKFITKSKFQLSSDKKE